MKKTAKEYIIPIIAFVFSLCLQIISSAPVFDDYMKEIVVEGKLLLVKFLIQIISYLAFAVPIGVNSIVQARTVIRQKEVLKQFGKHEREYISGRLIGEKLLNEEEISNGCINIRVFKKRFNRLVLEEHAGFYDNEINGELSFSIKKNEGLCVQAYKSGHSMLENEDAARDDYHLTIRQKALAGGLQFIVAVPIIREGSNVVSRVICFDSFYRIARNGCEERILKMCEPYAYMIDSIIN